VSETAQSESEGRAYFDQVIEEKSAAMRLQALKVTALQVQINKLEAQRNQDAATYQAMESDLQNTVELAKKMLKLEGPWSCAIDVGKLLPPPPQLQRVTPSPAPEPEAESPPAEDESASGLPGDGTEEE
jgi:hypothetical protein